MRAWLGSLTLASSVLAACHGKAPPSGTASQPAGPARLAGLWEQTLTRDGVAPPMVGRTRICLGDGSAAELSPLAAGLRRRVCDKAASQRSADGAELFEIRCELAEGGVSQINGRLARPSPTRFELREVSATSGAAVAQLNGRHVVDIEGRWLGPCPRGMSPGQATVASGFKIDLARAAALLGGGR